MRGAELKAKKWYSHWQVILLLLMLLISFLAPIISNDIALVQICKGKISFPFLNSNQEYFHQGSTQKDCFQIHSLLPYSSGKSDPYNMNFKGPFDSQYYLNKDGSLVNAPLLKRHFLGTNLLGRDLLADIIYGSRISIFISFFATLLAGIIAAFFGFISGWYGPAAVRVSLLKFGLFLFSLFLCAHILFNLFSIQDKAIAFVFSSILIFCLWKMLSFKGMLNRSKFKIKIPLDQFFLRFAELISVIPRIILVLAFMQFFSSSYLSVIILLAISAWIDLARMIRSEMHKIKELTYMEAAVMSGSEGFRLFYKQVLPNIWPSVMVFLLYTFAGNIIIEASLSFLGFGLAPSVVTLGGIIAEGKNNIEAWWMVVFPGIWLSLLIFALFSLSATWRTKI